MSAFALARLIVGVTLLILGAELLVRGASKLAAMLGISPLIIGLTVVAFGTSAPELAVGIKAAFVDEADLAIGNAVGSNIFNILFVLGLAATIAPLTVAQQIVRLDVPLMIGASAMLLFLCLDGALEPVDGALLFAALVGYLWILVRQARRESAAVRAEYERQVGIPARHGKAMIVNTGMGVLGLMLLVVGSDWLVLSAVEIATALGVSSLVIGLTVVAGGTSLPEVATSIVAGMRGERDIAVGNAIGSCIFNILAVLGLTAMIAPGGIGVPSAAINFDIPFMIAVSVACLPIFFHGHSLERWEGAVFLFHYVAYTTYLILQASRHDALPEFSAVMQWFVVPITALTIILIGWRGLQQARTEKPDR